jgi:myo-inositol-1(or 4)-monophosphatase
MMKTMVVQSAGLRRPGAAALDLAYVAAGFYDGFFEIGLNAWDVAAGSLLVLEAGGLIGDLAGEGGYLHSGQVIAATPKVFAQMVQVLAPHRADLARDLAAAASLKGSAPPR